MPRKAKENVKMQKLFQLMKIREDTEIPVGHRRKKKLKHFLLIGFVDVNGPMKGK